MKPRTINGLKKLVRAQAKNALAYADNNRLRRRWHNVHWYKGYAGALEWFYHKLKNVRKP